MLLHTENFELSLMLLECKKTSQNNGTESSLPLDKEQLSWSQQSYARIKFK